MTDQRKNPGKYSCAFNYFNYFILYLFYSLIINKITSGVRVRSSNELLCAFQTNSEALVMANLKF